MSSATARGGVGASTCRLVRSSFDAIRFTRLAGTVRSLAYLLRLGTHGLTRMRPDAIAPSSRATPSRPRQRIVT